MTKPFETDEFSELSPKRKNSDTRDMLSASDDLFVVAFRNSPNAILMTDAVTNLILEVNENFTRLFGYRRDELMGHTTVELDLWFDRDQRRKLLASLRKDSAFAGTEILFKHRTGTPIVGLCSANVVPVGGRNCNMVVILDLTENTRLQRQVALSEENFGNVFRFSPILLSISDLTTGRFVDCNESFVRVTGFSRDEVIGKVVANLGLWDNPDDRYRITEGLKSGRGYAALELKFWSKEGQELWGLCAFSRIRYEGQDCLLSSIEDITEKKNLEKSVFRQTTVLDYLFANIDSPIYAKDLQGRFVICNEATARMIGGYSVHEVIGRLQSDLLHGQALRDLEESDRIVVTTGEGYEYEQAFPGKTGDSVVVANKAPWRDQSGAIIGIIGISHDITERKCLETRLTRENAQKNQLFTILAHDLRGPVGNLDVLLGLLLENFADPNELKEILAESKKASSQTYNLLENLLGWVGGQLDDTGQPQTAVAVVPSLVAVKDWLASQAQAKNLVLVLECPPSLTAIADPKRLETILRNLVSNAIKYSPEGSTITVTAGQSGCEVAIRVVDHGLGIPPAKLAALFGGQKVDSLPGTQGERGNGLGLMFCADLARHQGGRLEAASTEGQGSTFTLTLPA